MASERNWTPEPWPDNDDDGPILGVGTTADECVANFQRAVACVNKLADFPNLDECVVVSRTEAADEFAAHLAHASQVVRSWPAWKRRALGNVKQAANEGAHDGK